MRPFLLARVGPWLLLATLSAQAPELPRLLRLGPMPAASVPAVRVNADGTRAGDVPADSPSVLLHAHPRAPAAAMVAELARLIAAGVPTVHFVATVPDGRAGAFTLALPHAIGALAALAAQVDRADPQALFWTSYALFYNGGDAWTAWQKQLEPLVRQQVRQGEHKGTWEPARGYSRIATSALHVLVLECYYRYSKLLR